MNKPLIKLRLILDVDYNPQGVDRATLVQQMHEVVNREMSNGTLTGATPATVEHYKVKVIRQPAKKHLVKTDDMDEQQRRDEENGLYPQYIDISN
jgi:hypothetical protein